MKKTLSIILAILMIVTTIPMAFAADVVKSGTFNRSNVNWVLDSDNVLTISGEGSMGTFAGYAFDSTVKSNVKEVIIKEGVTDIYGSLFNGWSRLTSVYIADSVENIGQDTFRNCNALTRICIGSGVKEIGYGAFMGSGIKVIHYNGTESMWRNITKDMIYTQTPEFHYLEKISNPATCTGDGQEVLVCTECNDTFSSKVIPASHSIATADAKAPTCTEAGWEAYEYCTACKDYTTYKEIPASHSIATADAKAPTCTEAGWDAYEYCTACEDYTTKVEIPASHSIATVEAKAKTCTEAGWDAYEYCTACEDYTTKVEIPASHEIVKVDAQAVSCTAIGWEAYEYCTACDYTTYVEIPVVDHADADNDGVCDNGGEQLICPDCDRPVHEGEFNQFICLVLRFFKLLYTMITNK